MRKLLLLTVTVLFSSLLSAQTYTTIADNTWSTDGTTDCSCSPGFTDDMQINHFADMPSGTYRGNVTIGPGGTFYVDGSLTFRGYNLFNWAVISFSGGKLEVTGSFVNSFFSLVFGDGDVTIGGAGINYGVWPDVGFNQPISSGPIGSGALPVEFVGVSAEQVDGDVYISWSTATELNNSHFIVQRSKDLESFENISVIEGAGTTNDLSEYTFVDNTLEESGTYYYQIAQVDFDGRSDTSKVVVTEFYYIPKNTALVYPTYVQNELTIDLTDCHSCRYQIYNTVGEVVSQGSSNNGTEFKVDFSSKLKGVYFVKVIDEENFEEVFRVIKE